MVQFGCPGMRNPLVSSTFVSPAVSAAALLALLSSAVVPCIVYAARMNTALWVILVKWFIHLHAAIEDELKCAAKNGSRNNEYGALRSIPS